MYELKKGQPGSLKLPHTQGPGRGPTIWCIVRSLTLFLHKRLFPGLEPVTLQSHDNNFISCTKVDPTFFFVHQYKKKSILVVTLHHRFSKTKHCILKYQFIVNVASLSITKYYDANLKNIVQPKSFYSTI